MTWSPALNTYFTYFLMYLSLTNYLLTYISYVVTAVSGLPALSSFEMYCFIHVCLLCTSSCSFFHQHFFHKSPYVILLAQSTFPSSTLRSSAFLTNFLPQLIPHVTDPLISSLYLLLQLFSVCNGKPTPKITKT